jgi:hypothetical protein
MLRTECLMLKCPHSQLYHRVQSSPPVKGLLTTGDQSIALSAGKSSSGIKRFDKTVFDLFLISEKGQPEVRS